MDNIKTFDLYVGKILAFLYKEFPCKCELNYKSHFGEVNTKIMFATLIWLKDSGFIDFESTINDDFIYNAILSAKGLELLKQKPKSLENSISFGEWLSQCASSGKDELIKRSASELLHYSLGFLAKVF